jgi:hypothetical protein
LLGNCAVRLSTLVHQPHLTAQSVTLAVTLTPGRFFFASEQRIDCVRKLTLRQVRDREAAVRVAIRRTAKAIWRSRRQQSVGRLNPRSERASDNRVTTHVAFWQHPCEWSAAVRWWFQISAAIGLKQRSTIVIELAVRFRYRSWTPSSPHHEYQSVVKTRHSASVQITSPRRSCRGRGRAPARRTRRETGRADTYGVRRALACRRQSSSRVPRAAAHRDA